MRAIRSERKKGPARLCPTFLTGRWLLPRVRVPLCPCCPGFVRPSPSTGLARINSSLALNSLDSGFAIVRDFFNPSHHGGEDRKSSGYRETKDGLLVAGSLRISRVVDGRRV